METFCRNLLDHYGFSDWAVAPAQGDYAGKTRYADKTVELHPAATRDVVIHEVAHVRAGQFTEAHGERWAGLCVAMGGTGRIKVAA